MKHPVEFPDFLNVTIDSKSIISDLTSSYKSYSDFNFTSLFCWNTDNQASYSILNNNLVIRLPDYITNEPVVSLLGTHMVDESIDQLLQSYGELQLVPQTTVDHITNPQKYKITEEIDHFDYVYSLTELSELSGSRFKGKRKRLNGILREHGESIGFDDFSTVSDNEKKRILSIFDDWADDKGNSSDDVSNERQAIVRLLGVVNDLPELSVTILFRDTVDIGFSINEIGHDDKVATCHFQKTIVANSNFDILLTNHVAKTLQKQGAEFVNWEQDLGIPGLRRFKQSYYPAYMLKKYRIKIA